MPDTSLQLTKPPSIKAQMLIRRPAADVFDAFANPDEPSWQTTRRDYPSPYRGRHSSLSALTL